MDNVLKFVDKEDPSIDHEDLTKHEVMKDTLNL